MDWLVIGINYKKANIEKRQEYALSDEEIVATYETFKSIGIDNALIISTCNRTEFFLPKRFHDKAMSILTLHVYKKEIEHQYFKLKIGKDAIQYFFSICNGLESQIIGDFEILGQVKKFCLISKRSKMLSGTWERIINSGIHSAKKARVETQFYNGASSTSYAGIEYLKKIDFDFKKSNFLLIGTGKIGMHSLDHLLKIVPGSKITVSNRSLEKAKEVSSKNKMGFIPFEKIPEKIKFFEVIICATNADHYIINAEMIEGGNTKVLLDLSVPMNIDPQINNLKGFTLLNIDQLSSIVNENLNKRKAEIEKVKRIQESNLQELNQWFMIKTSMPMFSELKGELNQLKSEILSDIKFDNHNISKAFLDKYTDELFEQLTKEWIRKVRNSTTNS